MKDTLWRRWCLFFWQEYKFMPEMPSKESAEEMMRRVAI
jgi:hypothetical protein